MTTTATEPITKWHLEPGDTSVEFTVKTFWGLTTVHGRFDSFTGTYETGPAGRAVELTVDADSLDTGNTTRDKHLREDGFFAAEAHPHVRFTSSRVHEVEPGLMHVEGTLEAGGKTVTLEFPATIRTIGDGLEIEATTTVDREDLEMSGGPLGMIARPVTLHVSARLAPHGAESEPWPTPRSLESGPQGTVSTDVHERLAGARRLWGPAPLPDHPLSKEERLPTPNGMTEELARDLNRVPGGTHLADDAW